VKFANKAAWRPPTLVLAAIFASGSLLAFASGSALSYLQDSKPDAATLLAPPPLPGSAEQVADLAEVVAVCHACPASEAAIAISEKKFSVFNFTPAVGPHFQAGKLPKTEAFFRRVQEDAAAACDGAKEFWKRPRPYTVDPSLASGKLEKSYSYPSGHSTEATVLALVLGDLVPEKRDDILALSRDIGWRRVQIARHYPTDIYAGRVFARAIVREMKASRRFQDDFAEAAKELKSASPALEPAAAQLQPAAAH
jgi:acid phosphatase (class A)